MFTVRIEGYILLDQHLIVIVFVVKESRMWPVLRVQSAEHFFHVHLCNASGGSVETIVSQIQPENVHNLAEVLLNQLDLLIVVKIKSVGPKRCFGRRRDMVIVIFIERFKRPDIQRNSFLSHTM